MQKPQQFFKARFTANARLIAAFIAICLGAYGLTMLTWLEHSQQRDVQLSPRKEAPDFLVTNAHYLDFQPTNTDTSKPGDRIEGILRLDIQSKTLSHFAKTKATLFEEPLAQFLDQNNETWLVTADEAIALPSNATEPRSKRTTSSEFITLRENVTLASGIHENLTMDAEEIIIDTAKQTLEATAGIHIQFDGGELKAGGFRSAIETGKIHLKNGVQAIYFPQGSTLQ